MYLKVTIPSRYAFPKSVGDPTIMDVTPLLSPDEDHLFINLKSYQTPWSQLNKKDEVFKIDNRRTLYPAFRTTSKIRPKMLPAHLTLFNFSSLGGKMRYAPIKDKVDYSHPHSSPQTSPKTYSKLEGIDNEAATTYTLATQNLTKEIYNAAYQKFFNIRGKSVMDFMEWVGTQKDLVGVWNHNRIDAEQLKKVAKVAYTFNEDEDGKGVKFVKKWVKSIDGLPNTLNVEYDQKILAVTPYETHPPFQQPRQPVPLLYSYDSELDVERKKMMHKEGWNPQFNPPVLDWEAVGFPRVATTATKALYARQPIHLQFNTQEHGFLKPEEVENDKFLATIIEECDDYERWFTKLTEPLVLSGERVYNNYILRGSIRSITEMSRNEAEYFDETQNLRESVGATLNFQSTGKAYQFELKRAGNSEKASHFPSGSLPSEMTKCAGVTAKKWEELYLPPPSEFPPNTTYSEPMNYYSMPLTEDFGFEHPLDMFWRGDGKSSVGFLTVNKGLTQSLADSTHNTKEPLNVKFKDVVLFPRFSYLAETLPFDSYPTSAENYGRFDNRWTKRQPHSTFRQNPKEAYDILDEIMEHYLIPNEFKFNKKGLSEASEGNERGMQIPLLIKVIDAINKQGPEGSIKVEMVKGVKAVKLIQDLSFKFDNVESYLTANPTSTLSSQTSTDFQYYLKKIAEHKGLPLEYQIILYPHPDNQGLSILTTIPAIPTKGPPTQRRAARNHLRGLFNQWGCRAILGQSAFRDELFKTSTNPLFLDEITRYSPSQKRSIFEVSPNEDWKPSTVESTFKGTAFGGYSYSLTHIRSFTTLSDPKNSLPITIKRNKITVKRPFSYTSIFPVLGKKGEIPVSLKTITPKAALDLSQVSKADKQQVGIHSLEYSPVAHYVVPESSIPSLPNNIPQYQFKNMNTNSRTFKAQRRSEGYAGQLSAKDYTTFSEIILPFENLTESLILHNPRWKGKNGDDEMMDFLFSTMITEGLQDKSVNLQLPFLKSQNNTDARNESSSRTKYLSNNLAEWSLGVPTDFVPETYTLSGMELGLFNWPLGLL